MPTFKFALKGLFILFAMMPICAFAKGNCEGYLGASPNWESVISPRLQAIIRKENNNYYLRAKDFAQQWGEKYADLVFNQVPPDKKVKIVIAMGGAEPLEVILRLAAERRNLKNVSFVELFLTTKIIDPWRGTEKTPEALKRSGIGPMPENFKVKFEQKSPDPSKTDARTVSYIAQNETFADADEVIVVDTGFNGTVVEAVKYAADQLKFSGPVLGALIAHNGRALVRNTVPISSLNGGVWNSEQRQEGQPFWWAGFIDEGEEQEDNRAWYYERAFQRSRPSPTNLILDKSGTWAPNTEPYGSKLLIRNYKSMLLGLRDGMASPNSLRTDSK